MHTFAVCPSPVPAGLTLALEGAFGVDALRVLSAVVSAELALIDVCDLEANNLDAYHVPFICILVLF